MRPRTTIIALILGALLVIGCSGNGNSGNRAASTTGAAHPSVSVDPTATADAIELLRKGTTFVDETSFRTDVDIAGQIATMGHVDNLRKRADATITNNGATAAEIRMVDDDIYLKLAAPGFGDAWLILDPAKVPAGFALSFERGRNDPGGSARLINAIVSARASGKEISGTLDASKVGTGNGISFKPPANGTFPESTKNQPFRATLDDQGRLVSFVIPRANDFPSASLRYSEFGIAVRVVRPSGAATAPEALYAQLGM
ncbi:hypothetical protein GCM10009682_15410 [Luedemannella flava]|uniref:LppX_LprAFG lipoprotein n=1 Tax=Luedemannella flava TaxID=349316 RepID=A0ABN2LNA4_9ACTN